MSEKEMQELLKFEQKYADKWVAKSRQTGKVIAASKSLKMLAKKLQSGYKNTDYVLEKILSPNTAFVPTLCGL